MRKRDVVTATLPNPTAGTDWVLTPAGDDCVKLVAVTALLTTSANVATRVPQLTYKSANGDAYSVLGTSLNSVASTACTFSWALGLGQIWNATVATLRAYANALPDLKMEPGDTVGPVTVGIAAGDQWSKIVARYIVNDEWEHLQLLARLLEREHSDG